MQLRRNRAERRYAGRRRRRYSGDGSALRSDIRRAERGFRLRQSGHRRLRRDARRGRLCAHEDGRQRPRQDGERIRRFDGHDRGGGACQAERARNAGGRSVVQLRRGHRADRQVHGESHVPGDAVRRGRAQRGRRRARIGRRREAVRGRSFRVDGVARTRCVVFL